MGESGRWGDGRREIQFEVWRRAHDVRRRDLLGQRRRADRQSYGWALSFISEILIGRARAQERRLDQQNQEHRAMQTVTSTRQTLYHYTLGNSFSMLPGVKIRYLEPEDVGHRMDTSLKQITQPTSSSVA